MRPEEEGRGVLESEDRHFILRQQHIIEICVFTGKSSQWNEKTKLTEYRDARKNFTLFLDNILSLIGDIGPNMKNLATIFLED